MKGRVIQVGDYDFSGWATRNDLKCSDGRTIRRDAFKDCDGTVVPIVWMHQHDNIENVLGHALLENRKDGVYTYGKFNDSKPGIEAKRRVANGDIRSLSIYANQLKQNGGDVLHGVIRELSLVLSPANPGAYIEFPSLAHGEDGEVDECFIYTGMNIHLGDSLAHSYEERDYNMDYEEIYETLDDDQKELFDALMDQVADEAAEATADAYEDLIGDYEDTLDDYEDAIDAYEDAIGDDYDDDYDDYNDDDYDDYDDVEHGDYDGETFMKHNVFDDQYYDDDYLMHSDDEMMAAFEDDVMRDIKRYNSFKESFLAHAEEYGVENLDYLFPDYHSLDDTPQFIKRKTEWVKTVIDGVRHVPFARIKSLFADITADEARARGYMKGGRKKEEVFTLLKRVTSPTTVYKKQRLDRDDKLDLKSFNVVSWLQAEMKLMLEEESARVIFFPDGRPTDSEDHVNTNCIRPIWTDDDLFTIKKTVNSVQDEESAETFINEVLRARKDWKGSGKPNLYITETMVTEMLLLKDKMGRRLYKNLSEIAELLRVNKIIPLPDEIVPNDFMGLEVNLDDYTVGTDNGGEVTWFDAFDIDYNQNKYLAETRFSGALTRPYSAIAFKRGS